MKAFLRLSFFTLTLSLAACNFQAEQAQTLESALPTIVVITATPTPSSTLTPLPTSTPTHTPTATMTPTPEWVWNEAGSVEIPILLYHHIADHEFSSRYYVSPQTFRAQMKRLSNWGYTTVPMSLLVQALTEGAKLPLRPIVITFDDGHMSVFNEAFPIMQHFDFMGVNYIVANRLQSENFMGPEQLNQLYDAGWEIGAHSMTHTDLTLDHGILRTEIEGSRLSLEAEFGVKIETFAYPFGAVDPIVAQRVSDYGYKAGIGLGISVKHAFPDLFYFNRLEVYGNTSIEEFRDLLPWTGALQIID